MKLLLLCVFSVSVCCSMFSQTMPGNPNGSAWNKLVDTFFDDFFKLNPTQATTAGFHQHDSELENYSQRGVENQVELAKKYLTLLDAFDLKSLSAEQQQDHQLLVNDLKSELLELEDIREWERNPDFYSSRLTQSAFAIMSRKFA